MATEDCLLAVWAHGGGPSDCHHAQWELAHRHAHCLRRAPAAELTAGWHARLREQHNTAASKDPGRNAPGHPDEPQHRGCHLVDDNGVFLRVQAVTHVFSAHVLAPRRRTGAPHGGLADGQALFRFLSVCNGLQNGLEEGPTDQAVRKARNTGELWFRVWGVAGHHGVSDGTPYSYERRDHEGACYDFMPDVAMAHVALRLGCVAAE
mmetsp:Transcript_76932/g.212601  ORF Transcript_76932/g.212601 Transcript_76932/m.212601 type:complete len:207 (+) Transcript_76932:189-809(+)